MIPKSGNRFSEKGHAPATRRRCACRCCRGRPRRGETAAARAAPAPLRLERRAEAPDQAFLAIWLAQKANSARAEGAIAGPFIGIGRNENDGQVVAVGEQSALQVDPAQARHLHIRYHARRLAQLLGSEKFFGGRKGGGGIAKGADKFLR